MEVSGKIIAACPEESGTSKAGNAWKKRVYVLETQETYPKKVAFQFFGDRVDQYPLKVGDNVKVSFDINSREFNGRWYTDISAWKAEPADAGIGGAMPAAGQMTNTGYDLPPQGSVDLGSDNDDPDKLPF